MIASVKKHLSYLTKRISKEDDELQQQQQQQQFVAQEKTSPTIQEMSPTKSHDVRSKHTKLPRRNNGTSSSPTKKRSEKLLVDSKTAKVVGLAHTKFDCTKRVPASAVSYEMVTIVVNSWEQKVRMIPHWRAVTGELLLRKMFELDPVSQTVCFGTAQTVLRVKDRPTSTTLYYYICSSVGA